MPRLRIRYRSPDGSWEEVSLEPATFAEEFPDAATGLPLEEIALDYSHDWQEDGGLLVFETSFEMKEWKSIDTGLPPILKRMVEEEEEIHFPAELSPQIFDVASGRWITGDR